MQPALTLTIFESWPLEKRLATAHEQATRWRNIARRLVEEQRARTNEERTAIRAERDKVQQDNAVVFIELGDDAAQE